MNLRPTFLCCAVILFVTSAPLAASGPTNHDATYRAATVPVVAFDPPDRAGRSSGKSFTVFGTGFLFQWNRRVVTCASVIDAIPSKHFLPTSRVGILVPPPTSTASLGDAYEFHAATVSAIDRALDIALLETDSDTRLAPLTRSGSMARLGADVVVSGLHPKLLVPTYRRDYVSLLLPDGGAVLAGLLGRGANGAPAYDSTTGDLVGLVRIHTKVLDRSVGSVDGFQPEELGGAVIVPTAQIQRLLETIQAPH